MNLPEAFELQMKSLLGEAGFLRYLAALSEPPARGLRPNLRFCAPEAGARFGTEPIPWAPGFFVEAGARPGLSPLHEAGAFYLQEPSAMVPAALLGAQPGERVLDLCAAPGGKSTQLADAMRGRGLLLCNEPSPTRAQVLSRNLERMGVGNALVVSCLPEALAPRFEAYFDRILVDAPCSGEGLFRRQPEAMAQWDAQAPARCAQRQQGILGEAARMLRPGGTLVYSTCTFNAVENEQVVRAFLRDHPDFAPVPFALPGLRPAPEGMLHLYPHEMRGEGHFVCRMRRAGDAPELSCAAPQGARDVPLPEVFAPGREPMGVWRENGLLFLPPEGYEPRRLAGLPVLRCGLIVGREKGRRVEPDHALAMALRPEDAARRAELTGEQALLYQAGEALFLGDLPPGYTLLTHEGRALGWGKQAGGMMKNHYPKGLWRRGAHGERGE